MELDPSSPKSVLKLAPIALSKGVNLELKPTNDLLLVKIDAERISQVLENLLGNALKFTPNRGAVKVCVSCKSGKKDFVEIAVSDTGKGILKENLKKIFDKFKRIDSGKETARGNRPWPFHRQIYHRCTWRNDLGTKRTWKWKYIFLYLACIIILFFGIQGCTHFAKKNSKMNRALQRLKFLWTKGKTKRCH